MANVEKIIKKIQGASEIEIMEFDFDDCFDTLRELQKKVDDYERILSHGRAANLIPILQDISADRKNSAGDYWHHDYCGEAAELLEKLLDDVAPS